MKQEIKYDKIRFYQNFIYGTISFSGSSSVDKIIIANNQPFRINRYLREQSARNRVTRTPLKQLDNDAFEPKKLKRDKVKEVLLSFRRNLQGNTRGERTNCSLTTFDYV